MWMFSIPTHLISATQPTHPTSSNQIKRGVPITLDVHADGNIPEFEAVMRELEDLHRFCSVKKIDYVATLQAHEMNHMRHHS